MVNRNCGCKCLQNGFVLSVRGRGCFWRLFRALPYHLLKTKVSWCETCRCFKHIRDIFHAKRALRSSCWCFLWQKNRSLVPRTITIQQYSSTYRWMSRGLENQSAVPLAVVCMIRIPSASASIKQLWRAQVLEYSLIGKKNPSLRVQGLSQPLPCGAFTIELRRRSIFADTSADILYQNVWTAIFDVLWKCKADAVARRNLISRQCNFESSTASFLYFSSQLS